MTLNENIKWISRLARGYRTGVAINIVLGVVSVLLSLLFIFLCKSMIDSAIDDREEELLIPAL